MKVTVGTAEYDLERSWSLTVNELIVLTRETGMKATQITALCERGKVEAEGSEAQMFSIGVAVWLARWRAGERLTFEAATDVDVRDVRFTPGPGEGPVKPDPTPGSKKAPSKSTGRSTGRAPARKKKAAKSPTSRT